MLRRSRAYDGVAGFVQKRARNIYAWLSGKATNEHTLAEYAETLLDVAFHITHCPYTRTALHRVRTLFNSIPYRAKALREGK